ncbi:phytanoyl-CoA dioxygenase family protein [Desertimonas flava]|uniref:phytanoyl-CoA dioxygenase family protein n=1 Tax=Desertimonas flava TaxID=2064846 RepID=UPI000E3446DF|nr:phytanoyl-CoA dioxygenase family protein [Desertimonas flava]
MDDLVDRKHLLTSVEMAHFVAWGFLRLDGVVPAEINTRAMAAFRDGLPQFAYGTAVHRTHPAGTAIGDLLRLPALAGAIQSLVGPAPAGDHQFVHVRRPQQEAAQHLHADAVFDTRTDAFDVQLMYFPEAVGRFDGGTLLVPGSHFRRVSHMDVARYQNVRGLQRVTCEPGTVLILHHGIWHGGGRNESERRRVMYKLRLNPTVRQLRLWNTDDIDHPDVEATLMRTPPWSGNDSRLEQMNRARLWRHLTGDETFDLDYYWSRRDIVPTTVSEATDLRIGRHGSGQGFLRATAVSR